MHRRIVSAAMATVLSLSAVGSLHAAPLEVFSHTSDKAAVVKKISFNVRNDSGTTLVLQTGSQQVSIEPGKTTTLKLEEGSEVITVNGDSHRAAGSLLTKVSKELQGNTLAVS